MQPTMCSNVPGAFEVECSLDTFTLSLILHALQYCMIPSSLSLPIASVPAQPSPPPAPYYAHILLLQNAPVYYSLT